MTDATMSDEEIAAARLLVERSVDECEQLGRQHGGEVLRAFDALEASRREVAALREQMAAAESFCEGFMQLLQEADERTAKAEQERDAALRHAAEWERRAGEAVEAERADVAAYLREKRDFGARVDSFDAFEDAATEIELGKHAGASKEER